MSHGKQALALALMAAVEAGRQTPAATQEIRAKRRHAPHDEAIGQRVNPERQEKKAIMRELGLSSRQWVRYARARKRAIKAALRDRVTDTLSVRADASEGQR